MPLTNVSDFICKKGVSKADSIKKLHDKVKIQIQHQTKRYIKYNNKGKKANIFEELDWILLYIGYNKE